MKYGNRVILKKILPGLTAKFRNSVLKRKKYKVKKVDAYLYILKQTHNKQLNAIKLITDMSLKSAPGSMLGT